MTISRVGLALKRIGDAPADVYLDSAGELSLVHDSQAIGQHARQRLMTFEGEWFLDNKAGVPWIEQVLGFQYDPVLAEAVFKGCLLDTDGVKEITSFSVRFDREFRGLSMFDIDIRTVYDTQVTL